MKPLLRVEGLVKRIGERLLFDIAEWDIAPGSAMVLTGVNGAGKSTLLRVLAGLETADMQAGSFDGRTFRLKPYPDFLRRQIVYVHQHPVMFSTSVPGNIAYGLAARGLPKHAIHEKVEAAMAWAGVDHLRHSDPARLSGGEKQRIALARARVLEPRLLLLDEPTSNLDGQAREQLISLVPSLVASGASVIIACHDRDLINLPQVHRIKLRDASLQLR